MSVYKLFIGLILRGIIWIPSTYGDSGLQGPPLVTGEMIPILATVGNNVKIDCPIDSSSSLKVYYDWRKDGETITSGWDRFRVSDKKLRIKGVLAEDGGLYQCKGTNGFGSKELSTRLLVQDEAGNIIGGEADSNEEELKPGNSHLFPGEILGERPAFSEISAPPPGSSSFRQASGTSLTLRCRVDGKPFPSITWIRLKDDVQIPKGSGQEFELSDLKYEDSGIYVCIGSNIYGQVNASFIVEVFERGTIGPTIISLEPSNPTVARGQLIHFRCLIKSDTQPSVQWLRELGDDELDSKSALQVGDVRYRQITGGSQVTPFHNGTYLGELVVQTDLRDSGFVCLTTNAGGSKFERSVLSILPVTENETLFPVGILLVVIPASVLIIFTFMALVICCIRRKRDPTVSHITTTATYATPRDAMNNDYQPPHNTFYNSRPQPNQHTIRTTTNGTNCPINHFNSPQYYTKDNVTSSPIKNHNHHASPAYASVPICDPTTSTFAVRGPPLPSRPNFNNTSVRDRNCYNTHGILTQPLLTQTASSSDSHDSRQSGGAYHRGPEFPNQNFPNQRPLDHWCTVNSSGGSEGSWDRKNLRNPPHQIRL